LKSKLLLTIITFIIIVTTISMFAACKAPVTETTAATSEETVATTAAESQPSEAEEKQLVFGYGPAMIEDPYWLRMLEGVQSETAKNNIKLLWSDSRNEPATQIKIMEDFISSKVDFILVSPVDPESLVDVINSAVDSGIPVITLGRDANTDKRICWIGNDEYECGLMQSKWIVEKFPDGANVLWLQGPRGAQSIEELYKAASSVFAENPKIKILAEWGSGFRRTEAYDVTETWLQEFPDVDVIYGFYDEIALGGMMAAEAANRLKDIAVVGSDFSADARKGMADGKVAMDVMKQPGLTGVMGVQVALDYLSGKNTKPEVKTFVPMVVVAPENMGEVDTKWAP